MIKPCIAAASLALLTIGMAQAHEGQAPLVPAGASFTTLVSTALAIEGLTGDSQGNLYTTGRQPPAGQPCPVWRLSLASETPGGGGHGAGAQRHRPVQPLGHPLMLDGKIIGAIGVSGGSSEQDGVVAKAAADALAK